MGWEDRVRGKKEYHSVRGEQVVEKSAARELIGQDKAEVW